MLGQTRQTFPPGGQLPRQKQSLSEFLASKGFSGAPPTPMAKTQDMVLGIINPITGKEVGGGSTDREYYGSLSKFFDANPGAKEAAQQYEQQQNQLPAASLSASQTDLSAPLIGAVQNPPPIRGHQHIQPNLGEAIQAPLPASLPGLSNLRRDNDMQTMQRGFMPQGNRGGINQFMNFIQSMMQLYQMFNSQGMGGMGGMGGQQGFGGGMPQMGGMRGGYQGYAPPMAPRMQNMTILGGPNNPQISLPTRMQRQTFGGPFGGY